MKRITMKISTLLIILLISLSSCSDSFLDQEPTSQLSTDILFSTSEGLRNATLPLYTATWFLFNDKCVYQIGDGMGGNVNSPYGFNEYIMLNVSPLETKLAEAWQSLYTVVGQANTVIDNIKNTDADIDKIELNAAIGEARFMRAAAFLHLVKIWGPVIIIENNFELVDNPNPSLNTIESVYEFIIRDLEFAATNLYESDEADRVTSWSAKGLLAEAYLSRSGLNGDGSRNASDLANAKKYAGDVCNNSGLNLLPNYADLFFATNNNNEESLFALQWMETSEFWGKGNTMQAYLAPNGDIAGVSDGWNVCWASWDMLNTYDQADTIRRNATFMTQYTHYPELMKSAGGYTHTSTEMASCRKYVIGSSEDAGVQVYRMSAPINTYMLRLAEVYLIYAEAILGNADDTRDTEALKFFNKVRNRAKMPEMESITLDDIYYERRVEFGLEGQYWYDLKSLYYFKPNYVLNMIKDQKREASYTYTKKDGVATCTIQPADYESPLVPDDANMHMPYPEEDQINNPNLDGKPVEYKFDNE